MIIFLVVPECYVFVDIPPLEKDILFIVFGVGLLLALLIHLFRSICKKHLELRQYTVQNRRQYQTTPFINPDEESNSGSAVINANESASLTSGSIAKKTKSPSSSQNSLWNREWINASQKTVNANQPSEYFNLF